MKTQKFSLVTLILTYATGLLVGICLISFPYQEAIAKLETALEDNQDYTRQLIADTFSINPDIRDVIKDEGSIQIIDSERTDLAVSPSDSQNSNGQNRQPSTRLDIDSTYTIRYNFPDSLKDSLKSNHLFRIMARYSSVVTAHKDSQIYIQIIDLTENIVYDFTHYINPGQDMHLAHIIDDVELDPEFTDDHFSFTISTSDPTNDNSDNQTSGIFYFAPYTYALSIYSFPNEW